MKLSKKLTLSFLFLIIISILIISLISNSMINKRFDLYLLKEREAKFSRIHEEVNKLLIDNNDTLDTMDLKHLALTEDIDIKIKNIDGKLIYNSDSKKIHQNRRGMQNHMNHMGNRSDGNYEEKIYSLYNGEGEIGSLVIGYIDNSYFTQSAFLFKKTLANSIILSGFIAILIGLVFSVFMSRGLTDPLVNIRNTANQIRKGNLSAKSEINTNTIEIQDLSQSINYLGDSLLNHERSRKRYASDISHELRTPLTTLRTHLEAIIDGVWDPNPEHLDILRNETIRLSKLVDDLKDSFDFDEYNLKLNKVKFNLSKELGHIITTYMPVYNKEDYAIEACIEDNIYINMDKDKLNQIMNNLLSNAMRYLSENGKALITLKKNNDKILMSVKDNGIGIKEEDLNFIFDRFYRIDTSRNNSTGGSGLGLSIVKSIVVAHEGEIYIESEYGNGSKITMEFPIKES